MHITTSAVYDQRILCKPSLTKGAVCGVFLQRFTYRYASDQRLRALILDLVTTVVEIQEEISTADRRQSSTSIDDVTDPYLLRGNTVFLRGL